jgi:hypothetical protein
VKAAYSSGKPAYGVGPGNVPAYIDRSADIAWAAEAITSSQSFDNATLCCSEQGLVLDRPIAEKTIAELVKRGAHVCDERETKLLARLCNQRGHMNPDVVGLDPARVAEMAGFQVPKHTTILLAHQGGVGDEWPLSIEILAPILSLHVVDGWEEGCRTCMQMLDYGGLGHTLAIHAKDERVLEAFFLEKPANRILVNGPASQGAVGYSTNLVPSMSLGCGPQAGNITSDNITAKHLINIKRVGFLRRDWKEIDRRDHARASALTGDPAPRGSGLPGDPGLGHAGPRQSATAFSGEQLSNWRGNPPVMERPSSVASSAATKFTLPSMAPRPSTQPASTEPIGRAPKFTGSSTVASATIARPASAAAAQPHPYVGMSLSAGDIQALMSHAGNGCPLGPCKGCPHYAVTTGECKA